MPIYPVFNEVIGKKTHANPMTQPKGSARVLENFETSRDNIYRVPRGRNNYGKTVSLPIANVNTPMQYKGYLYVHFDDDSIYYDNLSGLFTQAQNLDTTLIFKAPDTSFKMDYLEHNNNLYITTNEGIKKLDAYGNDFVKAGSPKGLGCDIRVVNVTGNWLADTNYVAYRHLWSIKDANNNKIIGAPSDRQEVYNGAGAARAVELRIYIPDDVTTNHLLELYRTTDQATTPAEDEQLVYQINPTSTDITNGYMIVTDITPSSFRGAKLYTNTTSEGIDQANEIAPLARCIDKYKNYMLYANISNLHRLYSSLISVTNLSAGVSTITFNDGTTSFTLGCYAANAGWAITNVTNAGAGGRIQITAVGHTLAANDYVRIYDVTGSTQANGVFEITATGVNTFDLNSTTVVTAYIAGGTADRYEDLGATPRFILSTGGTTAQNIDNTARSIVRCVNQCSPNTYLYGYITSNVQDPPGKMMFTNRTLRDVAFYMTVNSTATGSNFSPIIPTAGTVYRSTNDRLQNAFMWSKINEPEAVPLVNISYAGSSNDPIVKIIGLRDAVYIIKEKEGVYQLTGDAAPFTVDEFDGTVRCYQKESIAKGQNAIFMMSNLGYAKISNAGVEVIGRDNEYLDLKPTLNTNYSSQGKGWFYEDDKIYKTATMSTESSTSKDIVKVYNTFNASWRDEIHGLYTNDPYIGGGIVINSIEYTYGVTGSAIYKERKSYTTDDLATPDISVTIGSIDTTLNTVTLTAPITIPNEAILTQVVGGVTYQKRTIAETNNSAVIQLNNINNLAVAAATITPGIESIIEFNPVHCGSPFVEKFIKQLILQLDADETSIENIVFEIRTDKSQTPLEIAMTDLPTNFWGLTWAGIFGTYNVVDKFLTWATKEHTQCTVIYIKVKHTAAQKQVAIAGFGVDFDSISEGKNRVR